MRLTFGWTGCLLVVLFVLGGCHSRTGTEGNATPEKKDTGAKASAVAMTAAQFFEENKKDGSAFLNKHKGAPIELTGVVKDMSWMDDTGKKGMLTLEGGSGPIDVVMCYTKEVRPWNEVSIGQEVKVQGKLPEFSVQPTLIDVDIVHKGKGAAPVIKSEDLAAEITKDSQATHAKYKDKVLVVSGEILKIEKREVTLKGDGKSKITASFDGFTAKLADSLKVGDAIKIHVKYDAVTTGSKDGASFYIPLLMTK